MACQRDPATPVATLVGLALLTYALTTRRPGSVPFRVVVMQAALLLLLLFVCLRKLLRSLCSASPW